MKHASIKLRVRYLDGATSAWRDVIVSDAARLAAQAKLRNGYGVDADHEGWTELITFSPFSKPVAVTDSRTFTIEVAPTTCIDTDALEWEPDTEDQDDEPARNRAPLALQEDPRPPLCIWCVMACNFNAVYVKVRMPIDFESKALGMKFTANTDMPVSQLVAGYPYRWVAFLREIGPDSGAIIQQDQSTVGGYAEMELFGSKVCVSHLHNALESWRTGRRGW